jgi:nickel-responsive transcriptional regulator NikR
MGELTRTGIAIDSALLARFDRFITKQGYTNRSEALRDLIRDRLVADGVQHPETLVVGTVTLIYNHHSRLLPAKLTDVQHMYHELIISTTHVHFRSQHLPRGDRCEGRVGENTEVGRCVDRNQGCSTWPTCHELAHDLSLTNGLAAFPNSRADLDRAERAKPWREDR